MIIIIIIISTTALLVRQKGNVTLPPCYTMKMYGGVDV
jgi:hypothetical protein